MIKFRSLIMLLLLSAVVLAPLKLPTCLKQLANAPIALSLNSSPCSVQQSLGNSCYSSSYWLQDTFHLLSEEVLLGLVGILSFFLLITKYNAPLDKIYRPPICS